MQNKLMEDALLMREELRSCRNDLHRIPEVGLTLPQTSAYVCERLKEAGIAHRRTENCNVIAVLGKGEGCIMLRADMDALPVKEDSGESFASVNGNMHACGHDMHTAALIGAAKLLKAREETLNGQVKLLFQSGEEMVGGAKYAIEEGVLEDPPVDAAFAMHVVGALEPKKIVYSRTPFSSGYGFSVRIKGVGSHGFLPERGIDPINAGVHLHLALQELIAREVASEDRAVLTIGQFHAGSASNVIPESAVLDGTLRTFDDETEQRLKKRIAEITEGISKTFRVETEIRTLLYVPAVHTSPEFTSRILQSVKTVDDTIQCEEGPLCIGSEDFSFFQVKESSYIYIGAGVADRSLWRPQHNPQIRFDASVLPYMAAIHAQAAIDYLNE